MVTLIRIFTAPLLLDICVQHELQPIVEYINIHNGEYTHPIIMDMSSDMDMWESDRVAELHAQ